MLGANPNPHYIYLCKRRIGVLKADEMFKSLGYEVSNSEFVEELNTTTNTVVDNGYIKIIFYNNKTISIDADDIMNAQEIQAINEKCKELRLATIEKDLTLSFFHKGRRRF